METKILATVRKYRNIFILLAGVLVAYLLITAVIAEKLEDFTAQLQVQTKEQESLLIAIAQITARNGADTITESIVRDCLADERNRFDVLLGSLNKNLSVAELTELERLFGRCGSFFSERKSVMVARLTREIEVYKMFVDQLEAIQGKDDVETYRVSAWEELATQELRQSEQFSQLVLLQDKIITTLLAGRAAESPEIKVVLDEVEQAKQILTVASVRAAEIRQELIPL